MNAVIFSLFQVIDIALGLFVWAMIISAIMSWLVTFNVINTRNQFVAMIGNFLYRVTEPVLRPIRRIVPNLGGIDLSPVVLVLALQFGLRLLHELVASLA